MANHNQLTQAELDAEHADFLRRAREMRGLKWTKAEVEARGCTNIIEVVSENHTARVFCREYHIGSPYGPGSVELFDLLRQDKREQHDRVILFGVETITIDSGHDAYDRLEAATEQNILDMVRSTEEHLAAQRGMTRRPDDAIAGLGRLN